MLQGKKFLNKRPYSFIISRYLDQFIKYDGRVSNDTPDDLLSTVIMYAIQQYKSPTPFLTNLNNEKINKLNDHILVHVLLENRGSFYAIPFHRRDDVLKRLYTLYPNFKIFIPGRE
jgi:hypothetical protein